MSVQYKYLEMFLEEGAEILSKLYESVLLLEENPADREVLDGVLRLAHTLKGGAKMVGLDDVSRAAHQLEELLKSVSAGTIGRARGATPLLKVLDEIQSGLVLVDSSLEFQLEPSTGLLPEEPFRLEPWDVPVSAGALGGRISDRIRVSVERLDELQNLVDDLAIHRGRLGSRMSQHRRALRGLERLLGALNGELGSRERELLQGLLPVLSARNASALVEDVCELERMVSDLQDQVLNLRMVPLADVLDEFGRTVRDLAMDLGKEVSLAVEGQFTEIDRGLLESVQGPLRHLVRNAVDHGIETPDERVVAGKARCGHVAIRAYHKGSAVVLEVEDDGRGLDPEAIRQRARRLGFFAGDDAPSLSDDEALYLLCEPGFTTSDRVTEISGRGIGLDAVRSQVQQLKGSLSIEGHKGEFSRFRLFLPLSISSLRALIVRVGPMYCGIPSSFVDQCLKFRRMELVSGGASIVHGDKMLPLVSLARILGSPEDRRATGGAAISVAVLHLRGRTMALQVEEMIEEREVILKAPGDHLRGLPYVLGFSFLADEQPVPVLNVVDLHAHWSRLQEICPYEVPAERRMQRVLVVDDSMTTRHLERQILEGLGYEVIQAPDGTEAWDRLRREPVDVLLTDVEMPGLDGLALTRRVRAHASLAELPIVMISNRGEASDIEAGLAAGADVYFRKDRFNRRELGAALSDLLHRRDAVRGGAEALA